MTAKPAALNVLLFWDAYKKRAVIINILSLCFQFFHNDQTYVAAFHFVFAGHTLSTSVHFYIYKIVKYAYKERVVGLKDKGSETFSKLRSEMEETGWWDLQGQRETD